MSADQFEAKEVHQKWKYSNERTGNGWRKVEDKAMGSSLQKIELRVEKGTVMIAHVLSGWLASSYPIPHAFLQNIGKRVFIKSVTHKWNSSCHFAWRNGSIALWMVVHASNTAVILDLKGFLINQNLVLSTSEYHYNYQGRKWNVPDFSNRHNHSLSKVNWFIWSCRILFY